MPTQPKDATPHVDEAVDLVDVPIVKYMKIVRAIWKAARVFAANRAERNRRADIDRIEQDGLLNKLLTEYYFGPGTEIPEGVGCVSIMVDGTLRKLALASRAEWLNLAVPMRPPAEQGNRVPVADLPAGFPDTAKRNRLIRERIGHGQHLEDLPCYMLQALDLSKDGLRAAFSVRDFYTFAGSNGYLVDEAIDALRRTKRFDWSEVLSRRDATLALRHKLLPDAASLVRFHDRICAGGVCCMSAFARPSPSDDYAIYVKRRSSEVAAGAGYVSVVPEGFHQPGLWQTEALAPSDTLYRELGEEMYRVPEKPEAGRHDWYMYAYPQMQWFLLNRNSYGLECTGLGIDLSHGNYNFAALLAVDDPQYWTDYAHKIVLGHEFLNRDQPYVSTRNHVALAALIEEPKWVPTGYYAFVAGLRRLSTLGPERFSTECLQLVRGMEPPTVSSPS